MEKKQTAILVVVIVLIVAAVAYYFFVMRPKQETGEVVSQKETSATEPDVVKPEETIPAIEVDLSDSDELVRKMAAALSSNPSFARWLVPDYLIRRFVTVVDLIDTDDSPRKPLDFIQLEEDFKVREEDGRIFLDPKSYQRYKQIVDIILSIDSQGCVKLYKQLRLPIQEAYRELGYPDEDFNEALEKAMAKLAKTPIIEDRIYLEKDVVTYHMLDPELENLSPAQKHLLRMGPENVRSLQVKLKELAYYLGFSL